MPNIPLFGQERPYRGLVVVGGKETGPQGGFRRARGLHRVRTGSLRSRDGATQLYALDAHSLFRFGDVRFQGAGTQFYRNGSSINTGLNGNRLQFVRMGPTPGTEDYLFVAGGSSLFKVDSSGNVTNWGIAKPANGFTATKGTQQSKVIDDLDSQATWTSTNATLADEGSIKQEGTNSMKMTVSADTVGEAEKAITVDLASYASGDTSPDEDLIQVWVRVDNPSNLLNLQVVFSLGNTTFDTDTYTKTISANRNIPVATQLSQQEVGLAEFVGDERLVVADQLFGRSRSDIDTLVQSGAINLSEFYLSGRRFPMAGIQDQLDSVGTVVVTTAIGSWVRLRLPKRTFERNGDGSVDWADVQAVKLIVHTNSGGQVICYWDDMQLIGSVGMQGDYKYLITFLNETTGHRSNPNDTPVEVTEVERQPVDLSGLPNPSDSQVSHVEIWRTLGNGALYFKAGQVTAGTTTFEDKVADYAGLNSDSSATVLQALELTFFQEQPFSTFKFAAGPYQGRVFWVDPDTDGRKGRLYFSQVGWPEALEGFLEVSEDDNPLGPPTIWNGQLYIPSEQMWFRILGTDVFIPQAIPQAPGTIQNYAISPTPQGIAYVAEDEIRLFNGQTSRPVSPSLATILQGESAENLSAFEPVIAETTPDEVLFSDTSQTLAMKLADLTWRDLGVGLNAMYLERDTNELIATLSSAVVIMEDEGVLTDNGTDIPIAWEPVGLVAHPSTKAILQILYIDIDTSNEWLTPTVIVDGTETTFAQFRTASRAVQEIPLYTPGRVFSIRLSGSVGGRVELFRLSADVHALSDPQT